MLMVLCVALMLMVHYSYAIGDISTIAGTGSQGYSGDGGAATSAQLNNPRGVALDSSGNIYIADENNHRIRMINASTGNIAGQILLNRVYTFISLIVLVKPRQNDDALDDEVCACVADIDQSRKGSTTERLRDSLMLKCPRFLCGEYLSKT